VHLLVNTLNKGICTAWVTKFTCYSHLIRFIRSLATDIQSIIVANRKRWTLKSLLFTCRRSMLNCSFSLGSYFIQRTFCFRKTDRMTSARISMETKIRLNYEDQSWREIIGERRSSLFPYAFNQHNPKFEISRKPAP